MIHVYRLNYDRALIELLNRGFRFTQDEIEYVEDNVVYLEFGFKEDNHKFRLLKSKSEDKEFLNKRKEIIKRLIKECIILHVRDRWWLK